MKYFIKLLFLGCAALPFSGCEEQEYFKSESEIKKELAYSWKQVLMVRKYYNTQYEVWRFKEDSVTITFTSDSLAELNQFVRVVGGTYSIHTTMTKVFVTLSNFPDDEGSYYFNSEWTTVLLNDKVLVMACEDPHAGGVLQRDFTRLD
jgi:hypothetical protein